MTRRPASQGGFSLIELMVAVVIALVTSLAIFQLIAGFEAQRRRTTAGSDSQQQGAIASFALERLLRPAGAGLAQGAQVWGCQLKVKLYGTDVLPRSADWPEPFKAMPKNLRVAPLLAFAGAASAPDSLLVMHGQAGGANLPIRFTAIDVADPRKVLLTSTVGINIGRKSTSPVADLDIGLILNEIGPSGDKCELQRIGTIPVVGAGGVEQVGNPVQFSGDYGRPDGVTGFAASSSMLNMGARPSVTWIGVKPRPNGSGSDLVMHDALERDGAEPLVVADNVLDMRVLYGVDDGSGGGVAGDHRVDAWVRPDPPWSDADLGNGSALAADKFGQIQAVRVGLVLRSVYRERDAAAGGPAQVGTSSVTLFADTPAPYTRNFAPSGEEGRYRYDSYEFTVPLRNLIFPKASP